MEVNIDLKEYWRAWLDMSQTKEFLTKAKEMSLEMLQASKKREPAQRSDVVSMSIGMDLIIDLIESIKEDS